MSRQSQSPAPRGRRRSFDEEAALQAATGLFWEHGYEATSVNMLCEAIRLPSLYAAFGSKANLFLIVVNRYERIYWDPVWEIFDQATDLQQAFSELFDSAVDVVSTLGGHQGCLVVLSAVAHGNRGDDVAVALTKIRADMVERIRRKLEHAVSSGQLAPDTDTLALSHALNTVLDGIALRAKDGLETPLLRRLARAGAGMIPRRPQEVNGSASHRRTDGAGVTEG